MKYNERLFPDLSQAMGSTRAPSEGATKRSLPFKAPSRVNSGDKAASTSSKAGAKKISKAAPKKNAPAKTTATKAKSNGFKPASKAAVVLSSDEDSDELDDTPPKKKPRQRAQSEEEDEEEQEREDEEQDEPQPVRKAVSRPKATDTTSPIPQKLLTRLLYEGFEDKNMKIGKEAMNVVGKYMETFVREALARAVYERDEADTELGKGTGDGFLQVRTDFLLYFHILKSSRSKIWRSWHHSCYSTFERSSLDRPPSAY
jgi:hypothetical protein